jgi:hypothetical protein
LTTDQDRYDQATIKNKGVFFSVLADYHLGCSHVRADSQPQRDKRGRRKSRRSRETAKRILQVTDRIHHWAISPAHSSAGPIKRPLEDAKNPAVFKILSATKLLSIDLYARTPADESKKSDPCQKLRGNHWEDRSLSVGRRDGSLLNLLLFPLLLADKARTVREDGTAYSSEYGLHTFLELAGAAYKVLEADESRLDIQHLWWKPGEQIPLPSGRLQIFHKAGQWGLGTEREAPTWPSEWNSPG